ncbi:MAG: sigma-70 family RNA polymerase sigma factor [Lachnospiraceae bacterium]|nr:sigma-70 family RNA polymerase sigma factor [Lachnospiraceae bacterium]
MKNEELVELIRSGKDEKDNLEALYKQNMGFIWQQTARYQGTYEADDLMQEAFFTMYDAIMSYDPERSAFIHWLGYCIQYKMPQQLLKLNDVKMPVAMQMRFYSYKNFRNKFKQDHGHSPTDQECIEALDISDKDMKKLKRIEKLLAKEYLSETIGEGITLEEAIADESDLYQIIEDEIDHDTYMKWINEAMKGLSDRQKTVVNLRMSGKTYAEICEQLSIKHRQSAQQTEKSGLRKIRDNLQKYGTLQTLHDDFYKGGLHQFNRTFTSTPERIVIRHLSPQMDDTTCDA